MKKYTVLILLLTALMALAFACDAKPDAPEGSKGLFFEVSDGENELYLFGSIHLGCEEMYPLPDKVYDAFDRSDILVLELDIFSLRAQFEIAVEMLSLIMYQDGKLMTDIVPEPLFSEVSEIIYREQGIPPAVLKQYTPYYAASLLGNIVYERVGLAVPYGVEYHFFERAWEKEIIPLEFIEEQLIFFEMLCDEAQVLYLESALQGMDEAEEEVMMLLQIWKDGDVEALAALRAEQFRDMDADLFRDYYKEMTDNRDARMANRIEELLDDCGNRYFVIVGALHLAGENSIVDLLKRKGYSVRVIN